MNPPIDPSPTSLLAFPDSESTRRQALLALFVEWEAALAETLPPHQAHLAETFVRDGFYPHYFSQPIKILFIGRESLGIAGCDYLDVLLSSYRDNKYVGKQHLNIHRFHSRLLYVAYGLLKDHPRWEDIPPADEIGDTFATPEGISFAFMNVSKFSNESEESWQADSALMKSSALTSSLQRRFIEEEIALLEPDLIISMNLGEYLPYLGKRQDEVLFGNDVGRWNLTSHDHRSLLLNTWHFTSWKKDSVKDIYLPICAAVKSASELG